MKKLPFCKYHGTGNDFIMIDNRSKNFVLGSPDQLAILCDRRFGIGADGLILLEESDTKDFKMIYFNADGKEGSMCGNGGRCTTAFAHAIGLIEKSTTFEAVDGDHEARILEKTDQGSIVSLKMNDVLIIERESNNYILDTGSPHYITFVKNAAETDVFGEGKKIRYNSRFKEKGINVNFIEPGNGTLKIRTYERGVEDETWSCGTGSVAAALALELEGKTISGKPVEVITKGGKLWVDFTRNDDVFSDIWLTGPAVKVFEGFIETK